MSKREQTIQAIRNSNDDYQNTIYAIVGFMNIYRHELAKKNVKVKLFQGRQFDKESDPQQYVTPDIGILYDKSGVIGEVKMSFPNDENFWAGDFEQLLNYDNALIGWPLKDEKVNNHDIVLLVHKSRSRRVVDYYKKHKKKSFKFNNPFVIIEFSRSDQGKQFFDFRVEFGKLASQEIQNVLYPGVQLPMDVFVKLYSNIKLYDAAPTNSWMLYLIYKCLIDKLTAEGKYVRLNKRDKVAVKISIKELTKLLCDTYSFHSFHNEHPERQTHYPHKEWVIKALDILIENREAEWNNDSRDELTFYLKQYEPNALEHYIELCVHEYSSQQMQLEFDAPKLLTEGVSKGTKSDAKG